MYQDEPENDFSLKKTLKKAKNVGKKVFKYTPTGLVLGGVKKVATKKNLKKLGNVTKKVGKTAVKVVKKIANSAGMVLLLPLKPLELGMKKILKQKGESTSGNTLTIAQRFYNKVVKPKNGKNNHFNDSDEQFLEKNPLFSIPADQYNFEDENSIDPVTITLVVSAITAYFKQAKAKRDAKKKDPNDPTVENLTTEDAIAADVLDVVTERLEEKARGEKPVTRGEIGLTKKKKPKPIYNEEGEVVGKTEEKKPNYILYGAMGVALFAGFILMKRQA